MVNCDDLNCDNRQSAICLHCRQRLCIAHIVKHAKIVLHDTVDLHQQINELTEQVMNASKSVHEKYINAMTECNIWRAQALDLIEQTYNEMMEPILFQQESFNRLKEDLIKRLSIDALQPLKRMQIQQSGNVQVLDTIRLTVEHVREIIPLIRWPEKLLLQLPNIKIEQRNECETETKCVLPPTTLFKNTEEKIRADSNIPTRWQKLMNDAHSRLRQSTLADQVDRNSISKATPPLTTFTEQRTTNAQSITAAVQSNANQNLKDHVPSKKMIVRFADVSADGEKRLDDYLQGTAGNLRRMKMAKFIKVILGFLHAWYKNRTSNISNVILQRILFVKEYINNDNDKYTVILAVQVFVHHIKNDAQIVQTMATIVKFFLEQRLIQIKDFLDWYKKKNSHNLVGFDKAKECAQAFIETLQSTTA